ncbi:MAG: sulfur carrier protein ThiS [Myxococcota bacterium]
MSAPESDSSAKRNLSVNGDAQILEAPFRVATLLVSLGLGGKRVAVAVNRTVVARSRFDEVELAEGDRVEILEAVGGG